MFLYSIQTNWYQIGLFITSSALVLCVFVLIPIVMCITKSKCFQLSLGTGRVVVLGSEQDEQIQVIIARDVRDIESSREKEGEKPQLQGGNRVLSHSQKVKYHSML